MIDEKRIKRFIEGAKKAFKEVDDPTFTFPMNILSAYELATSIEELLKAQEPRVMTLEEAVETVSKEGGFVWIEEKNHPLDASHLHPSKNICDSPFKRFVDYGKEFIPKKNSVRSMWRCWSSWPTDEQKEAVKWE